MPNVVVFFACVLIHSYLVLPLEYCHELGPKTCSLLIEVYVAV